MRRFQVMLAATLALTLAPQIAVAQEYACVVPAEFSRGWFTERYDVTIDEDRDTMNLVAIQNGRRVSAVTTNLSTNNERRFAGAYRQARAITQSGRPIDVRYSVSIQRSNLRFTIIADIGNNGQRERARGRCVVMD
jgi:hypothetical protein